MKLHSLLSPVAVLPVLAGFSVSSVSAAPFYGDPPDEHHPWAVHDENRPQPPRVEPGSFSTPDQPGTPPSDAVILFDGTEASLANWEADKSPSEPTKWIVKDGALLCTKGSGTVRTRSQFGDCQLHVEWSAPTEIRGQSQGRGNSGIFPMGLVEVQVLDTYKNPTYADGFAGSVYGVNPPLADVVKPPGQWQVYDIIFRRPVFRDGEEVDSGRLTVFLNGVVVQDSTPLEGGGGHKDRSEERPFPEKGPLKLQDHGDPVRFRNIWYRPLPTRSVEGGTEGALSPEAAAAKKKEIAASIRQDAAAGTGTRSMLRLMESLCYEADPAVTRKVTSLADAWVAEVKTTAPDRMESRKGEILQVNSALQYLMRHRLLPDNQAAGVAVTEIVKSQGWDKK